MRKILLPVANVCRVLVGALFVVSGLIKINDALGFMYKLEEYFEPGALNLEAWTPWALELGMLASIGEVLLGVALLVGALPRLTTALTLVLMLFFTWLTWYTDHCDPFPMLRAQATLNFPHMDKLMDRRLPSFSFLLSLVVKVT